MVPRLDPDAVVDEVVAGLDEIGAVAVEGFLSPAEVDELRAELAPVLEATPLGRNDFEGFVTRRVYALFAKVRGFDRLAIHPLLLGVLDRVLVHYQLSAPVAIDIGPGEPDQGLHNDDACTRCRGRTRRPCSTRCGRSTTSPRTTAPPGSSPAATDGRSATSTTSATSSRRRCPPARCSSTSAPSCTAAAPTAPTSAASASSSSTSRRGCGRRRTTSSPSTATIARALPPRLQELLGYNVYPPFLGYVDGRHPRRVLS